MSDESNIAEFPPAGASRGAIASVPANERRKNERQIATFRTCCVMVEREAHPAILRNVSEGGAMFEALIETAPGTLLSYYWDGIEPVAARVAWVDGTRIGVANISGPAEAVDVPRPRATRVPAHLPVRVWSGCKGHRAELENISLSGLAVHGLDGIEPGTLCTIEIGGQTLHNASVVRTDDGITGIRFERPLPPARLMQLLDGEGPGARVATHPATENRIAALRQMAQDMPRPSSGPTPNPARPAPASAAAPWGQAPRKDRSRKDRSPRGPWG